MTSPHRGINPPELPRPSGYTYVVEAARGRTLYLAGQTAQGPDGDIVGDTMGAQFMVAADNLLTALIAAGGRPEHITSMTIFVTDVKDYQLAREPIGIAWRDRFHKHYPAITLVEVKRLWDSHALIEIQAIAVIPD